MKKTLIIFLLIMSSQLKAFDSKGILTNVDTQPFSCDYPIPTSNNNKEIALLYLKKYENKDLKGIQDMFSDNIVLRDWKIRVEGKESAINETRKNFESVKSIKIEVLSICESNYSVAAELKIIINDTQELYVIDLISIDADKKISSIKAFIGRGDK